MSKITDINLLNEINENFTLKWSVIDFPFRKMPFIKNHSTVLFEDSLLVFGGHNKSENINSIYIFNLLSNQCSKKKCVGDIPKPRNGHSSTLIPKQSKMIMIGGWTGESNVASNAIYSLDLNNYIWKKIVSTPSLSHTNMHTADLYGNKIYIFRGGDGVLYYNDLISFNTDNYKIENISIDGIMPSQRANHTSAIIKDNLFIFGGWNGNNLLNDLYCINLTNKISSQVKLKDKPCPRAGARMVAICDSKIILFGGFKGNGSYLNDIYHYDLILKSWENITTSQEDINPLPRAGHSMNYSKGKGIYVFGGGGNNGTYFNDLFLLQSDEEPSITEYGLECCSKSRDTFSGIRKMFNDKFLSDVTIEIENEKFFCHKIILSLLSEKMKNLIEFNESITPNKQLVIKIKEYSCNHFKTFLQFLYFIFDDQAFGNDITEEASIFSSKLNFNTNVSQDLHLEFYEEIGDISSLDSQGWSLFDYFELLKIGDEYVVDSLKKYCEKKISSFVTNENFNIVDAFAKEFNCDFLKEYLLWYYKDNMSNINNDEYTIRFMSNSSIITDKS